MAGSTAEITWTSKDEAIVRTLEKTERGMDQLARKMDKLEASSKKATQATVTGFDAATMKVGQFVTAFAGVGSVMAAANLAAQTLKQEWETLKRQQKGAADANLSLAQVLPSTYRQAGGLLSAREVESAVQQGSRATGVGQVSVAQAIGEALAARGATNKQEAQGAIDAAVAALRFAPEADPATIAALAGGTTDIQRRFGVSAEQSIGFLARVGGQARVTSLREQVQNLNPAIGALTQFGASPQFAGGLVSTLTGATGDFTGAISSTASIQLAKQLTDRGFATPEAGMAALQADPNLRNAFLKGGMFGGQKFAPASFEAKAFPAIRELLTGGSALSQNLVAATREVGSFEQGGQTYSQMIREIDQLGPVRLARTQRAFTQGTEELRLRDLVGAEGSVSREGLAEILDASGAGSIESNAAMAGFELTTGGGTRRRLGDVSAVLRRQAQSRLSTSRYVSSGPFQPPTQVGRTVTDDDRRSSETLNRVAALLEDIARETREQTTEMKAGRNEPKKSNPASGNLNRGGIR